MSDRWLVFSDLDGTLLNHHDYRFDASLPMMQHLQELDIPLIFNTSKTLAEMRQLAHTLHNQHPFIVENGSAIVLPANYFPDRLVTARDFRVKTIDDYRLIVLGVEVEDIHAFIRKVKPQAIDFSQCSVEQAMQLTGLSHGEAAAAQQRGFSVPLLFEDPQQQNLFTRLAGEAGYSILRGGRFVHILGACDKGSSMLVLKGLFEESFRVGWRTLALGDSPNDLDMLNHADRAVIVNSPSSHQLLPEHEHLYLTSQPAPEGWVEGIRHALAIN